MRRLVMVALVALVASTLSAMARADDSNPNQIAAKEICNQLRDSGQLAGRKIGVRYLNGTVWLQGQVADGDHYGKVIAAVLATPGVSITRVVPDDLTIDNSSTTTATSKVAAHSANPLRGTSSKPLSETNKAQAVPSSIDSSSPAMLAAMMQPMPAPPAPPTATPASPSRLPPPETSSGVPGPPLPMYSASTAAGGPAPVRYDQPALPAYAWPSYAAYPNYAAVTYPKQYSPTAWPYIGPFYPYPQVPLGWRKVSLQWDDGWWWIDFRDKCNACWWR